MIGRDLIEQSRPTRWIIDFGRRDILEAMQYAAAFDRVKEKVMPTVLAKAEKEKAATGKESTRWTRMAGRWWQFRDYQPGTMTAIAAIPRYIACSRVTKRPIFEFVSNTVHPDNALIVFPLPDDYSFGVLQSGLHWAWFMARCSTLKGDFRYTCDTVFDTFPWPQAPTPAQRKPWPTPPCRCGPTPAGHGERPVQPARPLPHAGMPGKNPLRDAQEALDAAVRGLRHEAEGRPARLSAGADQDVAAREAAGESVVAPGLPPCVQDRDRLSPTIASRRLDDPTRWKGGTMAEKEELIPAERIERAILFLRGHRVMLDRDLAPLYGVPTRVLNQAVRRNLKRFPDDFMFQLSKEELENWRSQIVTSDAATRMGLRRPPLAFTEQGVAMLSSVLHSTGPLKSTSRSCGPSCGCGK